MFFNEIEIKGNVRHKIFKYAGKCFVKEIFTHINQYNIPARIEFDFCYVY